MKKIMFAFLLCFSFSLFAQEWEFNYKAIVSDDTGAILSNQAIDIRFVIERINGSIEYIETHSTTTDANGLVNVFIGDGTPAVGTWSAIDWSDRQHHIRTEYDTGAGYILMSTQMFKSVPYANYAKVAETATDVDFSNVSNTPTTLAGYGITDGGGISDADFFKTGTTDAPTTNTDDIFTMGNVGIGTETLDGALTIESAQNNSIKINNTNTTADATAIQINESGNNSSRKGISVNFSGTSPDDNGSSIGYYFEDNMNGLQAKYASYNDFKGTNAQDLEDTFGTYNYFRSASNYIGSLYGTYNRLESNVADRQVGLYNHTNTMGSGRVYGVKNSFAVNGSAILYGVYNAMNTNGSGTLYGVYNYLDGAGTGYKYGVYSIMNSTAGGTHYAVYGEALKVGSYAGYFDGDVTITRNLTLSGGAPATGKILTSDASGNATWQDNAALAPQTKTINYSSNNFNPKYGATIYRGAYGVYIQESTTISRTMVLPINLPEGSKITTIKFSYMDNSTSNLTFNLTHSSLQTGVITTDYTYTSAVTSSAAQFYTHTFSNFVLNNNTSYYLEVKNEGGPWGNGEMIVIGVQITYEE